MKYPRRIAKIVLVMLLGCGVFVGVAFLWLRRDYQSGGPPPVGYGSRNEILAAVALRALPLVDREPPLTAGVVQRRDLPYGQGGGHDLLLDLYLPQDRGAAPVPGLIFIHGGAWKKGNRADYRVYTMHFASQGYVAATITYRLTGEAPFPAAVEDAKCAVRWMRAQAANLGIDPMRIAVIGGSAGGHLAMMVGYSPGEFEGTGGYHEVSSAVAAVVDIYGPANLTSEQGQAADEVHAFLGGKSFTAAPDLWRAASPVNHLDASDPPTLIMHGTLDELVDVAQADELEEKLRDLGVPCEYERLRGWPHTMDAAVPMNAYFKERLGRFFADHLGEP